MDISHLQYFIALCEEKNYTAASRKCYVSRQALRQSVQALEHTYGVQLIRNEHNHLSVTPEGKLLLEHAKNVMSAYQEMNHSIYSAVVTETPLRLGISRSLIPFYAPELIHEIDVFCRDYPGVKIERSVLPADMIIKMMQKKELDCAILIDTGEPAYAYERTVLAQSPMRIFLSAKHPLAQKNELSICDLDHQHVQIMSRPDICFASFLQACNGQHVHPFFDIVPDYYEVGYNVLNKGYLAIDRYSPEPVSETDLDLVLPLEHDRFQLYTVLISDQPDLIGLRILKAHLRDNQ